MWSNKGKERCGFELVLSKSLSSQFWFYFHVSNTVVAVDLFVAVAAAAAVVVPVVGKDIQE